MNHFILKMHQILTIIIIDQEVRRKGRIGGERSRKLKRQGAVNQVKIYVLMEVNVKCFLIAYVEIFFIFKVAVFMAVEGGRTSVTLYFPKYIALALAEEQKLEKEI